MRILVCNEKYSCRYGLERVLLVLGSYWKKSGHEVILMGSQFEETTVQTAYRRIVMPMWSDEKTTGEEVLKYLENHWNQWFRPSTSPDAVLVAGWSYLRSIPFLKDRTGAVVFYDYGLFAKESRSGNRRFQIYLRKMRDSQLKMTDCVIASSHYLEETQSRRDAGKQIPVCQAFPGLDGICLKNGRSQGSEELIHWIQDWKKQGEIILFQTGEWDETHIRESYAGVEVIRFLKKSGERVHSIVMARKQDLKNLPEDVVQDYVPVEGVDDTTLKYVIGLTDIGFSPTTRSNPDLLLGEIQSAGKSIYAMNTGTYAETVAHSWFLCRNLTEMAEKVLWDIHDQLPLSREELSKVLKASHDRLTWENCSRRMMEQIQKAAEEKYCFVDVSEISSFPDIFLNGGVVEEICHVYQVKSQCIYVLWNCDIKEYVFPDKEECYQLYNHGSQTREQVSARTGYGVVQNTLNQVMHRWQYRHKIFILTAINEPVLEKIRYLHANGFFVVILVTGGDRSETAGSLGVPPEDLAESDVGLVSDKRHQTELINIWRTRGIQHGCVVSINPNSDINKNSSVFSKERIQESGIKAVLARIDAQYDESIRFRYEFLNPEHRLFVLSHFRDENHERIIILSNFYPPKTLGGAEIIAHEQAKSFRKRGHDVLVLSLDPVPVVSGERCQFQELDGIPVVRFRIPQTRMHIDSVYYFDEDINVWAGEVFHIFRPDIVLGHNLVGMSLGILDLARNCGAKIAVTLHDNWGFCAKNTLLNANGEICHDYYKCRGCAPETTGNGYTLCHEVRNTYIRRMLGKADLLIAPSQYIAHGYIRAGYAADQIAVISNGIDVERFSKVKKLPSERIRISFFGYFGLHKGVETLIWALDVLKDSRIELELIGGGQRENAYRALAEQLGRSAQVRFWGRIPNSEIEKGYAETDILCLPSVWPENQPVSICEAMACGIPVIASDLGGNGELIHHGVNGYLFRAGDKVDLADKLQRFLDDPDSIIKMGLRGQAMIRGKNFEAQSSEILNRLHERTGRNTGYRELILWKGVCVPREVAYIRRETILLMNWVLDRREWGYAQLCVLEEGQTLTWREVQDIHEYDIPILVPQRTEHMYSELKTLPYTDLQDMYLKLAGWKKPDC